MWHSLNSYKTYAWKKTQPLSLVGTACERKWVSFLYTLWDIFYNIIMEAPFI